MQLEHGKRFAVFSIRNHKLGSTWVRAGTAWVNKDESLTVFLDVLPLDGKLHVREAAEKVQAASSTAATSAGQVAPAPVLAAMGGH